MRAYDVIMKKRDGHILSKEEIKFMVMGYVKGEIPDYQMASFLMAVYLKGMSDKETTDLTLIFVDSGDKVDLSSIPGVKVDKHSTGGVGDTTTLILAPIVAAAGIPVAKMSGRGLGHTGGTLDKLESIPGLTVDITQENFFKQVKNFGIAVIGQTGNLVPADKKIYALRDVTATVESIALIASSVMSKKIAAGSDAILLDVKVGSGAFMKNLQMAKDLAIAMVDIGKLSGKDVKALLTNMDEPLGAMIGNALEVHEAILILTNKLSGTPLEEVSLILAGHLIHMGKKASSFEEGLKIAKQVLQNELAAEKFKQMIKAQGGDPKVVDDVNLLPQPKFKEDVLIENDGYVYFINAQEIGIATAVLGAGRHKKEDIIDPAVGIVMKKRVGDTVKKGDVLAQIWSNNEQKTKHSKDILLKSVDIRTTKPQKQPLVYDLIE